ncbi:unnamed protein product, partial [Owenia fusiformis]
PPNAKTRMLGLKRIFLIGFISLCLVHYISAGQKKNRTKPTKKLRRTEPPETTKTTTINTTTSDGNNVTTPTIITTTTSNDLGKNKNKNRNKNKKNKTKARKPKRPKNTPLTTTTSNGLRSGLEIPECVPSDVPDFSGYCPPGYNLKIPECCVPVHVDFDPFGGGISGEGNDICPTGYELNITCTTNSTTTTTEKPVSDVDENGLKITNPVEDKTASEEAPLPNDLVSSGAEEDGIASAERATNNLPPPGYDGSDSKADDTPAELKSLSDEEKTISEKAVLEGNTIDVGDGLTA